MNYLDTKTYLKDQDLSLIHKETIMFFGFCGHVLAIKDLKIYKTSHLITKKIKICSLMFHNKDALKPPYRGLMQNHVLWAWILIRFWHRHKTIWNRL